MGERLHLREEIAIVLNKVCTENASNTPDFILAGFLVDCLRAFDMAVQQRETWYGRDARPTLHGEVKEQPDVWEAFIAVGWKLSHYIANGEICSDRSCFRCRLADLLFDAEKRMPRKEQP